MITVTVDTSCPYKVMIGESILSHLGEFLIEIHNPCKVAIVSDSRVWSIYGNTVETILEKSGFCPVHYVFPAGESSKNPQTYMQILRFLAQNQITRSDLIIALGGGVVGDMAGFAAATFLRGIAYVQIPTSLLAMVDSSVGGKTAIDLPEGKNLVGAFYQPKFVLCDIALLDTLSDHYFLDGCAEIIKYAVLFDPELFEHLRQKKLDFNREYVITRCIELKRAVVVNDEHDLAGRQLLNLGHTFGHSIEKLSNYSVTHGFAVAAGICMAAAAANNMGLCTKKSTDAIIDLIRNFRLFQRYQYNFASLAEASLCDKKRFGGTIHMIFPKEIGHCSIEKLAVTELQEVFKAGLTPWTLQSSPEN